MTPRAVDEANMEDTMSDENYDDWEVASVELGTKIVWNVGNEFVGKFTGIEIIPIDDKNDGYSDTPAATFEKMVGGRPEKYWCWLPFSLRRILMGMAAVKVKTGDTVRIRCLREEQTNSDPDMNPTKVFEVAVKPKK